VVGRTASGAGMLLTGLLARLLECSIERIERGHGLVEREGGCTSCKGLIVRGVELAIIDPEDGILTSSIRGVLPQPSRSSPRTRRSGQPDH
jgi:hypothetical protein